jgi:DNA-binding transcriptional LysR family regulator
LVAHLTFEVELVELRHLRYFVAVAEEGHVTRAAARLGIQQPPLSAQIKALEKELGITLFTRHARGVELTAGGSVLLESARAILASVERAKGHVVRAAEGTEGNVCVGFTTSVAAHSFASEVIRAYRRAYPRVGLDLRESNAAELTELTARGEMNVAMLRLPVVKPPGLAFDLLLEEEMVLVLPRDHALLRRKRAPEKVRISLRKLAGEPFILVRRPGAPGMYADLLQACFRAGFTPHVAAEVDHMLTNINLVAAGIGVSVVPASMRGFHLDSVVYCRLDDARGLHAPITLAYLAANRNPAAANFIALAHERASARRGKTRQ